MCEPVIRVLLFRVIDATIRVHLVRQPPTSLQKQVRGYMRLDNLQLVCVQPPTSLKILPSEAFHSFGETFGNYLWGEIPQAGQTGQGGLTGLYLVTCLS